MKRFNLKKLHEVKDEEQYRVEVSNKFTALENVDVGVRINRDWKIITRGKFS
jgi:hypothetical protein